MSNTTITRTLNYATQVRSGSSAQSAENPEFDRLVALADALARVPKSELDEKRRPDDA